MVDTVLGPRVSFALQVERDRERTLRNCFSESISAQKLLENRQKQIVSICAEVLLLVYAVGSVIGYYIFIGSAGPQVPLRPSLEATWTPRLDSRNPAVKILRRRR